MSLRISWIFPVELKDFKGKSGLVVLGSRLLLEGRVTVGSACLIAVVDNSSIHNIWPCYIRSVFLLFRPVQVT